ncbi:glucose-1-phosphate adenylyltransferase, beta subunit GlgD-like protein [Candidatus Desulfosporosinus infrequens]|uniref:Glucose-1-phosphate adenylyltransferase, beta subunit GlgD-like protein n=1 Tax=Candidatus Desulfosporosinus infrequens TaxID=2043169 RepID=A0A2U3KCY5_9FIRM|nr:glucose-1-phosphate adenylyltransferase, beta subunit GlgD-like protein [Candidatus Desulfosporosinus infrequens]
MSNATGIIFANSGYDSLQGLAQERPIAAVPFGGRYRILDFALSSMVNSGLRTIGLVTPRYNRPLLDHLGAGKDWFLDRKAGGLFILPGVMHGLAGNQHTFCIKDLHYNTEYLQKDFEENVVISRGDQIFNVNFQNALESHNNNQADVTLIYKVGDNSGEPIYERLFEMDKNQKVYSIKEQTGLETIESGYPRFVNMFIIRRDLLLNIVEKYGSAGCMDLIDILAANLEVLNIYGSPTDSLIGLISTVNDYFHRSMDLLDLAVREKLWLGKDQIHTKIVDNPPTRYTAQAKVSNSLIASGCTIDGEVLNSIVFRGVIVERGCQINNSIILPNCHIYENAQTELTILDKFVKVNAGNILKGSLNNPLVVIKSTVI